MAMDIAMARVMARVMAMVVAMAMAMGPMAGIREPWDHLGPCLVSLAGVI